MKTLLLFFWASLHLYGGDVPSREPQGTVNKWMPLAILQPGGGWEFSWQLHLRGDGSARLQFGSSMSDNIDVPPNTFPLEKRLADIAFAIEVAPYKHRLFSEGYRADPAAYDAAWDRSALRITRMETESTPGITDLAIFTPEIKAYFDRMLQAEMSDRMKMITAQSPIFSEKVMKSLSDWTNSSKYKERVSAPPVTAAVSAPVVAKPTIISAPVLAGVQPPVQPVTTEPASIDVKDNSLGVRGWLVIGLLAIAAFLGYRFIRLRLGS